MGGKMMERELTFMVRHHEPVVKEGGGQSGSMSMTVPGGKGSIGEQGFTFRVTLDMTALVIEFTDDKLEFWVVRVEDLIRPIAELRDRLKEGKESNGK